LIDLEDANSAVSYDWRFGIAYNAALKLCTILLYSEGYRPAHGLEHYRTITALPLILGQEKENDAQFLNVCRSKRNIVEYDCVGGVSKGEAEDLIAFVKEFRKEVIQWLKENHSDLSK
jgi:uncharacterized protein (UPF0332 family)